jgi:nitroimidazol reductase NimA-like FMN-containing flavoprotein (pyridoxamine 5'-phosphate oxidase superfamily)
MEEITDDRAKIFLMDAAVGHIGIISDGEPYVTPMSFVLEGNRILFRTKPGKRYEGMAENPTVSIEASTFDEESGDWISVIVKGTASLVIDDETIERTVQLLLQKYESSLGSPLTRGGIQPMATFPHVMEVTIEEITGMRSGGYMAARTRPGRL